MFGKIIEKLTARLAQMNIVGTKCNMDRLSSMGVDQHKIRFGLIGGLCFGDFQKVSPSSENVDIIFVGRLVKSKGVDLLLRAVKWLKKNGYRKLKVGVIGDGPERRNLESLSRELGVEHIVKFYGRVESDQEAISIVKSSYSSLALATGSNSLKT